MSHDPYPEWESVLDTSSDWQLARDVLVPPCPPGLAAGAVGAPIAGVWVPRRPSRVTLTMSADAPGVQATITSLIGSTKITKGPLPLTVGVPRSVRLFGKFLQVDLRSTATGGSINAHCALTPDDVNPLGELWTVWSPTAQPLGASGVISTSPGTFLTSQGTCIALGGADAAYYLMFFDATAVPAPGTQPLIAIGPLIVGTQFSYSEDLRPKIEYSNGLCWGVSTTDDTATRRRPRAAKRAWTWGMAYEAHRPPARPGAASVLAPGRGHPSASRGRRRHLAHVRHPADGRRALVRLVRELGRRIDPHGKLQPEHRQHVHPRHVVASLR